MNKLNEILQIVNEISKEAGDKFSHDKIFRINKETREQYPELDKIAKEIADSTIREINRRANNVTSEMPYKAQHILEEVIKYLQDKV